MAKHPNPRPPTHRCGYIPWHVRMRQLGIDVETCPRCRGKMKLLRNECVQPACFDGDWGKRFSGKV